MSFQSQTKFDVVGSFMPPKTLSDADKALAESKISQSEYTRIADNAVCHLIQMQLQAGLPTITTGELKRKYWNKDFYFGLNGITREYIDTGHLYQPTDTYTDTIRLTGKITYNSEHPFFEDFLFLKDQVGHPDICRQTLPAPTELYNDILDMSEGVPDKIYSRSKHLIDDIAAAYRQTIRHFYDLGCRNIQLDDTVFGRLCDKHFTKQLLQGGIDLLKFHEDLIILFNLALEEIPSDMNISAYISAGDPAVPEWHTADASDMIMPKVLSGLYVDTFILPFNVNDPDSLEILKYIPKDKHVALGLMSVQSPCNDDSDAILTTVKYASRYIPAEHLSICPTGGFKLQAHALLGLTFEDQWRKIENLALIAGSM